MLNNNTTTKGINMHNYKLDALRVYKVYNAYGIVEAEKELNKLSEVRNLKLWEKVALQNQVKKLMEGF
jgi:hypothetical protein